MRLAAPTCLIAMPSVLRIIDANVNRAREALRVMEEAARFLLDDAALTAVLKQLRHDLASVMHPLLGSEAHRDTPGDVGTGITADDRDRRDHAAGVALAAGKRLSEALRAVEEYARVLGPVPGALSDQVAKLRYRGYDLERRLNSAMGTSRPAQWYLCVLISEALCRDRDWFAVAEAAVAAGCDCLQLREKHLDDAELVQRACRLRELCHRHGASIIVNDRADVALVSGADGVHLGQHDLSCAEVRKLAGHQLLVGVSTSCLQEAAAAIDQGADYCGIGPMFPTTTKRKDVIVGSAYARAYLERFGRVPHLAIGGVTVEHLADLVAVGVKGVAVSSAVCSADDPARAVRQLLGQLGGSAVACRAVGD